MIIVNPDKIAGLIYLSYPLCKDGVCGGIGSPVLVSGRVFSGGVLP